MRVIAAFAVLLTLAYATPSLEKRQQGENCIVSIIIWPLNVGAF
jgi:hypothetical protein